MSSVKLSMNPSSHLMISLPDVHFTWLHIPLMGIDGKQIMLGASKAACLTDGWRLSVNTCGSVLSRPALCCTRLGERGRKGGPPRGQRPARVRVRSISPPCSAARFCRHKLKERLSERDRKEGDGGNDERRKEKKTINRRRGGLAAAIGYGFS